MKQSATLATLLSLFACSITEPVCACQPPGGGSAVITGTVRGPAEQRVEGSTVRLQILRDATCEVPDTTITTSARSNGAGRFRHTTAWSGGRKCFGLWAEPPQGSALAASDRQVVRIDFLMGAVPDSVEVTLHLR